MGVNLGEIASFLTCFPYENPFFQLLEEFGARVDSSRRVHTQQWPPGGKRRVRISSRFVDERLHSEACQRNRVLVVPCPDRVAIGCPDKTVDRRAETLLGFLYLDERDEDLVVNMCEVADTRIVHYGDSPTTADLITGEVRSLLQKRFGNAGHGFVLMEKPWAWYQHAGVEIFAFGWLIVPASHFEAGDGMFGLGGVSFTGAAPARSGFIFRRERYSQFEVWFLRQPGGGVFTVSADGQILGHTDTSGDSKSADFAAFRAQSAAAELVVQVDQGSVRLFGVTAEKPGPGVVYDSLGLNGGSITVLAHMFNQRHWTEELRHRHPDLLIVNYGTNEAGFPNFIDKEYEGELREAIRRIHAALPSSSVLIMSPMDRGQRTRSGEIETMADRKSVV